MDFIYELNHFIWNCYLVVFFFLKCQMKQNETEEKQREPVRTHGENEQWTMNPLSVISLLLLLSSERIKLLQCCNFQFFFFHSAKWSFSSVGSFKSPSLKLRKKLCFFFTMILIEFVHECKGIHKPTLMIQQFFDWSENLRILSFWFVKCDTPDTSVQ